MARTVLDRGITGACSICWLIASLVMLIAAQLMTSYKLKTEIVYYTAAQYYEVTNGTATLTLEEVFDTSDDKTMETANLWHLAKKFHDYGAVLFAFWVPLFAGVLAPLAIFLHLYGVFFHNSRERMSRKFEPVPKPTTGLGGPHQT